MIRATDMNWELLLNSLVSTVGGGGIVGLLSWMREKERERVLRDTAKSAVPIHMVDAAGRFQEFLNDHSEKYMATLKDRIDDLEKKVDHLQKENLRCQGEANQLRQHVESLEEFLRRHDIPVPKRHLERSLTVMEDGHTTTMRADAYEDDPPTEPYRPRSRRKKPT